MSLILEKLKNGLKHSFKKVMQKYLIPVSVMFLEEFFKYVFKIQPERV